MNATTAPSTMSRLLGSLLRVDGLDAISDWRLSFAAAWAARLPLLVGVLCVAAAAAAVWFYVRCQPEMRPATRAVLAAIRGSLAALLVLLLADPVLQLSISSSPRPLLWLLFDGSESMAIEDDLPDAERATLAAATGLAEDEPRAVAGGAPAGSGTAAPTAPRSVDPAAIPSRADYVAAWVRKRRDNVLESLAGKFRLRAYVVDSADGVRPIDVAAGGGAGEDGIDTDLIARQLSTKGQVTALGRAFDDLALRHSTGSLQGVVMVSDFDQNAGPPAAESARRLGVPVYTVGVGPAAATDVAVDIQAPPMMKKSERSAVVVTLRQSGLGGASADVTVKARPLDGPAAGAGGPGKEVEVGRKTVPLAAASVPVEFAFTPEKIGRHEFVVEVAAVDGELVEDNNRAAREVSIRDDFLRLLYVEYEPTWEWRFIKEVFHRDPLVGMRGFRTFLRSADPQVRATNELFLPTPAPRRAEFFANDVIFLGDMPATAISSRFCDMTREFVETFGGGLVVIAGNRFGPAQLAETPLADMLPVVFERGERPREQKEFSLRLTAEAGLVDFMQLGGDEAENRKAWSNLGPLPWYQPVARPHPQATVLAVHPTDKAADGRSPQPIIAIRRYGRGEVVYVGFNETWRLRRRYGERYYRQLWGQMIHRLALSHALGDSKRFVVRTDAQQYRADDTVIATVEAYDADFEPLAQDDLADKKLVGRLLRPDADGTAAEGEPIALAQLRKGVFEARFPSLVAGEHRLAVKDPVTGDETQVAFTVTAVSAERRAAVRNESLQKAIAAETSGRSYDLASAGRLIEEVNPEARPEVSVKVLPLGMTWLCFGLGVLLMVAEWIVRKRASLP
jgi:hypothetical protein